MLPREIPRRKGRGKLVLVTAMTPSAHGEGKTITSIGLGMALERAGHRALPCLRQPSLGPVFGVKGGATGGGKATVEPSDEINLGFTGDLAALASAQNLLAAMVDNHLHQGNRLGLDPSRIFVPRTIDLNDRALRRIRVGIDPAIGPERADRYVITAASEVATIHVLTSGYADLGRRFGKIVIGLDRAGAPVRADSLEAAGAMAALARWTLAPNLVLTSEGTAALVHGGPFANLGVGTATTASIRFALAHADFAVVEAGFATDLGAEKFVDVVAPSAGLTVHAAVLVATLGGVRHQGGDDRPTEGSNSVALRAGFANLDRHVENLRGVGLRPVVAVNRHPTDDRDEVRTLLAHLREVGADACETDVFRHGSAGAIDLAERVEAAVAARHPARSNQVADSTVQGRLDRIARDFYGAASVGYAPTVEADLTTVRAAGLSRASVVVAKTHLSLGDDPAVRGGPSKAPVTVRSVAPWGGAGVVLARLGSVVSMPGLPEHPAAERIRIDASGIVRGVH